MTTENRTDPYAPCHCGSGKKYKFCCMAQDREAARKAASAAPAPEGDPAGPDTPVPPDAQAGEEPQRHGTAPPAARRVQGGPDAGSRFHGRGAPSQLGNRSVLAGQRIRGSQRSGSA